MEKGPGQQKLSLNDRFGSLSKAVHRSSAISE